MACTEACRFCRRCPHGMTQTWQWTSWSGYRPASTAECDIGREASGPVRIGHLLGESTREIDDPARRIDVQANIRPPYS